MARWGDPQYPIDPPAESPDWPPYTPPTPPGGLPVGTDLTAPPANPLEEDTGGGGGGGGAVLPAGRFSTEGWSSWLGSDFFKKWLKGGFGYDPRYMDYASTALRDTLARERNRSLEGMDKGLAYSGQLYGGVSQDLTRQIQETYAQNLSKGMTEIEMADLQQRIQGRNDFFTALSNWIEANRGYGLSQQSLGLQGASLNLQEQGMWQDLWLNLLNMM